MKPFNEIISSGKVVRGDNATLRNYTSQSNLIAGTKLLGDRAQVFGASILDSGQEGLVISCDTQFGKAECTEDRIIDSEVLSSAGSGIIVDNKAHKNVLSGNTATGNSPIDLFDLNKTPCDSNQWIDNTFGNASPTCIH